MGTGRNRGRIERRGEDKWLIRWFVGRDSSGRRIYRSRTVSGKKKDAQRLLTEVQRDSDRGTYVEPTRISLDSHLNCWLDTIAKTRVRPRTLDGYRWQLANYVRPKLGRFPLSDLRVADIQSLYAHMLNRGLSPRTVRLAHAPLRSALQQAVKWDMISRNPADLVELPRSERREGKVLSGAELPTFLQAIQEDRWSVLWMLLLVTGLRPGEALGLKWSDLESDRLFVQRTLVRRDGVGWEFSEPKTARSRRPVTLPSSLIHALEQHKRLQLEERMRAGEEYHDRKLIFATRHGEPLDWRRVVSAHFRPILKNAGLPPIRPYDLRHTSATLLLAMGEHPKVVSERLGHSSVTLTLDTYSHVLPDMQQAAADKMETLLRPLVRSA